MASFWKGKPIGLNKKKELKREVRVWRTKE
jgi:hypothetical protein